METLQEKTAALKQLIFSVQRSAKQAWKAGEILQDIQHKQEYLARYNTFEDYTKFEFNIGEQRAKQYIKIQERIPYELITDNMLVGHLSTIADLEMPVIKQLLNVMRSLEKNNPRGVPYDREALLMVKQIIEASTTNLTTKQIEDCFKFVLEKDEQEDRRRRKEKKNLLETATPIQLHPEFSSIATIYPNEPVSEQGLIALFCTCFSLIKDKLFYYRDELINFDKILYVRQDFPDAKLQISKHFIVRYIFDMQLIDIEFEFDSFNYWRHKHHESDEKCDLIICWQNNWKCDRLQKPPILVMKEFLETGEIELYE